MIKIHGGCLMRDMRRNDEWKTLDIVIVVMMFFWALHGLGGCASRQESKSEVRPVTPVSAIGRQSQTLTGIYDQLIKRLQSEIKSKKAEVKKFENQVRIIIPIDVLFSGGGWTIDRKGNEILDKVVPVLKELTNQPIEVYGYTDNSPIGPSLRSKFSTNLELSLARAVDTVSYFQKRGIDRDMLTATGYGAEQPAANNDTPLGRAKNRRMEIAIIAPDS
jgi:chemotaxis protein MotB